MSIAEKTLLLKQDFDEVHAKGYEDGKNSVAQIDRGLKTATFTSLNMFNTSEAVLNFDNLTSLAQLFTVTDETNVNTTVEHLTINTLNSIRGANQMLTSSINDNRLKHLTLNVDFSECINFKNFLTKIQALETIDGTPLNLSSATNVQNMFSNIFSLVDARFVANSIKLSISFANSPNLSTDTIQSIIDGLADLTGGTAQTLTLHSTVGAKLTDEQKATITAKNWELVY